MKTKNTKTFKFTDKSDVWNTAINFSFDVVKRHDLHGKVSLTKKKTKINHCVRLMLNE